MSEAPRLRAMGLGEILDAAFRLYRGNLLTFVAIFALSYVPVSILSMGATALAYHAAPPVEIESWEGLTPEQEESYTKAVDRASTAQTAAEFGSVFLYLLVAHPLATGAVTRAVGTRYLNEEISVRNAYRAIGAILFRYLGAVLLTGIVIMFGFMICLLPGLLLMTRYAFVAEVVVLEGRSASKAPGRSRELVRGSAWRVFGYLFLATVVSIGVAYAVELLLDVLVPAGVFGPLGSALLVEALQNLVGLFTAPYFSVVLILLYYDLRIRKEAYDLEVLAADLGRPGAPTA